MQEEDRLLLTGNGEDCWFGELLELVGDTVLRHSYGVTSRGHTCSLPRSPLRLGRQTASAPNEAERDIVPACQVVYLHNLIGRSFGKSNGNALVVCRYVFEVLAPLRESAFVCLSKEIVCDRGWIVGQIEFDKIFGALDGLMNRSNGGVLSCMERFRSEMAY